MVNYAPLNLALEGLQKSYESGFKNYAVEALSIDDPFAPYFDEQEKRERSNVYGFTKETFNNFQAPYASAGWDLGLSFYSILRASYQEESLNNLSRLVFPEINSKILSENLSKPYDAAGMLRKVYYGDYTLDFAAQSGARGVADLVRATTASVGELDTSVKKKPWIATSAGACDFCRSLAREINNTEAGHAYNKVKFHKDCSCILVFKFL